ncbi:hypothetical protein EST38_g2589 [Candolleomyces aberdarensis]|uniref:WD40 repeat-like protein n=1 Tax=Candolleomyces aberdarensis TaxID=2316362 RepID=A0A4Q2DSI3_9AGAR|nr:hypothetical protein EST38_g2589 [Candolleomyces aberdarensis]
MYTCIAQIAGHHTNSINCLAFSNDGEYLASGDDNGLVLVCNTNDGRQYDRYHYTAPVTALAWMPKDYGLLVGLSNCELYVLPLGSDKAFILNYSFHTYGKLPHEWRKLFQINCLAFEHTIPRLAIGVGETIVVLNGLNVEARSFEEKWSIHPDVNALDNAHSAVPPSVLPAEVRSMHFLENGNKLVVALLQEGIRCYDLNRRQQSWTIRPNSYHITRSCIDSQARALLCSNAFDGFDLYDLNTKEYTRTFRQQSPESANVALPALFIHDDRHVLLGSATGPVTIVATADGRLIEQLSDGTDWADMVQAIAYSRIASRSNVLYIATGSAEKGEDTYVKIWRQESYTLGLGSNNPGKRSKQLAPERVTKGVSTEDSAYPLASSTSTCNEMSSDEEEEMEQTQFPYTEQRHWDVGILMLILMITSCAVFFSSPMAYAYVAKLGRDGISWCLAHIRPSIIRNVQGVLHAIADGMEWLLTTDDSTPPDFCPTDGSTSFSSNRGSYS